MLGIPRFTRCHLRRPPAERDLQSTAASRTSWHADDRRSLVSAANVRDRRPARQIADGLARHPASAVGLGAAMARWISPEPLSERPGAGRARGAGRLAPDVAPLADRLRPPRPDAGRRPALGRPGAARRPPGPGQDHLGAPGGAQHRAGRASGRRCSPSSTTPTLLIRLVALEAGSSAASRRRRRPDPRQLRGLGRPDRFARAPAQRHRGRRRGAGRRPEYADRLLAAPLHRRRARRWR